MKIWAVTWAPDWRPNDPRIATVGARTVTKAIDEAAVVARKAGYRKIIVSKVEHTLTIDRVAR